jgi:hypothetical protein
LPAVAVVHFRSGDFYRRKVLGVGLGDWKEDCVAAWGEPVRTENTPFSYEIAHWRHKGYALRVHIQVQDRTDPSGMEFKKGTVVMIAIAQLPG